MPKLPDAQNTPLKREAEVVKNLTEAAPVAPSALLPPQPKRAAFRRHFAGYELGLVTVGMVLTFALLALPRPSMPMTLPLPRIDRAEARRSAHMESDLATRAEAEGLPFEVRAVGEGVRQLGRRSAQGEDTGREQQDIHAHVKAVLDAHDEPLLLRLRAVQTQYFLAALRQFERDSKPNPELDELGGDFVARSKQAGWLSQSGRLLPDEAILRVLFHLRWADLIGKRTVFPFAPTLNDWRIYYRFLLQYPARDATEAELTGSAADAARLRAAVALGRKDPDYPTELAQGYLLYQLGDAAGGASAYRRHLAKHEDGPYALLARNYLIYSLQGVSSE
jgi:hypothetical protein